MAAGAIPERLDALRAGVAGCQLVAFADLSADLVLASSSRTRPPQEELDALCALARRLLDGATGGLMGERAGLPPEDSREADGPLADLAVAMLAGRTCVFVRSPREPSEAICCEGAAGMDIADAIAAGRALLVAIGDVP